VPKDGIVVLYSYSTTDDLIRSVDLQLILLDSSRKIGVVTFPQSSLHDYLYGRNKLYGTV
jgi:hypothetical protein